MSRPVTRASARWRRAWAIAVLGWLVSSGIPQVAAAWGPEAHQVIAEVAFRELTAEAKEAVRDLLSGASLASVASWADEERQNRPQTRSWHFVAIPREASGYDAARDCGDGSCLVAALSTQLAILRNPDRDRRARMDALKFVVHLVGDLHQPLHCADDRDHGGNDVQVSWFGQHTNLHRVWDSEIRARESGRPLEIGSQLGGALTTEAREAAAGGEPIDWLNECHGEAVDVAYAFSPSGALGKTYYQRAVPVVDRQLTRAGVRLAKLLNDAFKSAQEAATARKGQSSQKSSCIPREECCRVCPAGQRACGGSCIPVRSGCRTGPGCACDAAQLCPADH